MRTTGLAILILLGTSPAGAKAICADGRFELTARGIYPTDCARLQAGAFLALDARCTSPRP